MQSPASFEPISAVRNWTGLTVTVLVTLFMLFDAMAKVVRAAPVVQATVKTGLPANSVLPIGVVLLGCTAVYLVPNTTVLGAILLTGYLGGAAAIQVRNDAGVFPVIFPILFAVLVWAGVFLREPRLASILFVRR